jgi:hypothetical protein
MDGSDRAWTRAHQGLMRGSPVRRKTAAAARSSMAWLLPRCWRSTEGCTRCTRARGWRAFEWLLLGWSPAMAGGRQKASRRWWLGCWRNHLFTAGKNVGVVWEDAQVRGKGKGQEINGAGSRVRRLGLEMAAVLEGFRRVISSCWWRFERGKERGTREEEWGTEGVDYRRPFGSG